MVCLSVCLSVCRTSERCKNGCTDRAAVCVEDLGGPGEPCIRWGPDPPMGRGDFEGRKGRPIVKYRDVPLCGHLYKNGRTGRDALWVVGSDRPRESCVRWGFRSPKGRGNLGGKGRPL